MKTMLLSFVTLALFGLTTTFAPLSPPTPLAAIESPDCQYSQCRATAKSTGKRCKHCVSNYGDKYCWQHK